MPPAITQAATMSVAVRPKGADIGSGVFAGIFPAVFSGVVSGVFSGVLKAAAAAARAGFFEGIGTPFFGREPVTATR